MEFYKQNTKEENDAYWASDFYKEWLKSSKEKADDV